MGRIHRYGQTEDCLIFNFVATNTVEGHVLRRLLEKLQEIRDALEDDAVFNVVSEILPANKLSFCTPGRATFLLTASTSPATNSSHWERTTP